MTSVEIRKTESNSTVSQQPGFELVTRRDSGRGETLGEMELLLKSNQSVSTGDLFRLILKTGFFLPGELFFRNLLTQFCGLPTRPKYLLRLSKPSIFHWN